jgi:hypothetical protein
MIWAVLAFLGVPLWLCALGILVVVRRNRTQRKRQGNVPVRVLLPGKTRWTRGHALWVGNVFAWRGSPAAWNEALELIVGSRAQNHSAEERRKLRHLGDGLVVLSLETEDGVHLRVAARDSHARDLLGPHVTTPGLA